MSATTAKPIRTRLGIYVREQTNDRDFYHLYATIVTIGTTAYERKAIDDGYQREHVPYDRIRNASDESYAGLYLENLQVDSQGNNDDTPRKLYGWEVRYRDCYSVDRWKAQKMDRTLRTIESRMQKSAAKYGEPASFGAYLARVAEAIGADAFVFCTGTPRGWSYSDNEHEIAEIKHGIYRVDRIVHQWIEKGQKEQNAIA